METHLNKLHLQEEKMKVDVIWNVLRCRTDNINIKIAIEKQYLKKRLCENAYFKSRGIFLAKTLFPKLKQKQITD